MPIANGTHISRPLKPGVFAPIPTFFLEGSQDIDIPTLKKHVAHVGSAGVGIVMCGSMGEAHHLTADERIQVLKAAREALDEAGLTTVPIIAGTGAGSTRETIKLSKDAAQAGADYTIVIPSGYFAGALANDRLAIKTFFKEVAEGSPLPVMVYNYPGASGGIDMDSDLIEEMAAEIPNLCGVKLTCGNVGKLTRIAATVSIPSFAKEHPRKNKDAPFLVLGGFIDFLLPSLYANAHGAITGLANLYPHTIAALWNASVATLPTASGHASDAVQRLEQAQHLQGIVARADRTIAVSGIAGTKWLLERKHGYGGVCRRPLGPLPASVGEVLAKHKHVVDISQVESELEKAHKSKPHSSSTTPAVIKATNGVQNGAGVPVSNSHESSSTPASSLSPATPSTSAENDQSSVTEKKKSHSRSGSLSNSVRSLFGSLKRKKATVA